jgi:NADPH:quinone reductase-like Zn-dependent oxidoreductase
VTVEARMKAAVYDEYGSAEVLRLESLERPIATWNQMLIRVHYAGVNPIDIRTRRGELRWLLRGRFPRIPGFDVAGEVVRAPDGSGFRAGDRVCAFLNSLYGGACAEYAVCTPGVAAKIPERMSYAEAAALPLAGLTAWQCLVPLGGLQSGMEVLINGASGGVGAFAVQIAVAKGARVTGVASAARKEFVESLGAAEFLDYGRDDFTQSKRAWDLIVDVAGVKSFRECRTALKSPGRYVSTEPSVNGYVASWMTWCSSRRGLVMLVRPSGEQLRELLHLHGGGRLRIFIDSTFRLEEIQEAHRRLEHGVEQGKVVVGPIVADES